MEDTELYRRMRTLVGRRCRLDDGEWQIVDVLGDEASLVLRRTAPVRAPIQTDAFGNAVRRAPETRLVPYLDEDSGDLSEEARALLLGLQPR